MGLPIYRVNTCAWGTRFSSCFSLPEILIRLLGPTSLMSSNHLWERPAVCSHGTSLRLIRGIDPPVHVSRLFITHFMLLFALLTSVQSFNNVNYESHAEGRFLNNLHLLYLYILQKILSPSPSWNFSFNISVWRECWLHNVVSLEQQQEEINGSIKAQS